MITARDKEMATLERLFSESKEKYGHTALVRSAPGNGKSHLVERFDLYARSLGALTLSAKLVPPDRDVPFSAVRQLLRPGHLPEEFIDGVLELFPGTGEGVVPKPEHMLAQETADFAHAFAQTFVRMSQTMPIVITLDDIQHIDPQSRLCLVYLVRQLRTASILLVLTEGGETGESLLHTELIGSDNVHYIRLPPLNEKEIAWFTARHALNLPQPVNTDDFVRLSGGNLMLLDALIKEHQNGDEAPALAGPLYRQALDRLIHRVGGATVRMSCGIALLTDFTYVALLDRLMNEPVGSANRALHVLRSLGLANETGFQHPMIRNALITDVPSPEVIRLHLELARLLDMQGAPRTTVAEHLLRAGPHEDPWIFNILQEAAEQALAEHDQEAATNYLQMANRIAPDRQTRAAVIASLAEASARTTCAPSTRLVSNMRTDFCEGYLSLNHALPLTRYLVMTGQGRLVPEVLDALELRARRGEALARTEFDLVRLWVSTVQPEVLPPVMATTETEKGETDIRHKAFSLLRTTLGSGAEAETVARADQILRYSHLDEHTLDMVPEVLIALIAADHSSCAISWCDRLIDRMAAQHAIYHAFFLAIRAEAKLHMGDASVALKDSRESLRVLDAQSWGVAVGYPLALSVLSSTYLGEHAQAAQLLEKPVPQAMYDTRFGVQYLIARGNHHLLQGRPGPALVDFQLSGEKALAYGFDSPVYLPWRTYQAAALFQLGRVEEGKAAIRAQLDRITNTESAAYAAALLVSAAPLPHKEQIEQIRKAGKSFHASGNAMGISLCLGRLAETYQSTGEPRRARLVLEYARKHFGSVGLESAAEIPRSRTERQHADSDILSLSESERRTASLAAQGYSNREIATQLFITVSTVEQHLTRVYRKLGLNDRRDLPSELYFDGVPLTE
ncbi:AAA family ATPase [Nocardiopsis dassonvillei]|uniref:helix-turn-helix transcriptional regulator n=1 Tax=Nocardiopsis dassonvillei TaxID=2014 RepID=UPI00200E15D5|nr:LuxR family transcriptional regulator [Nocardiopsis dassonvillei]MCK9873764.1 AAA family ATPase [Nocardiopsis dassonvillei]